MTTSAKDGSGPPGSPGVLEVPESLGRASARELARLAESVDAAPGATVIVDVDGLARVDSRTSLALASLVDRLVARGFDPRVRATDPARRRLLETWGRTPEPPEESGITEIDLVERLGERTLRVSDAAVRFLHGLLVALRKLVAQTIGRERPRFDITFTAIVRMGVHATPLVALIAALIGIILALHSAPLLRLYGQELRIADLVGLSMTKEIGPLLTAILVAGRSGSSLTAEIGTMKVSEEIDALEVMGVHPIGYLVTPRLRAMIVVLPVLTILADVIGVAGGLAVGSLVLDLSSSAYLTQTMVAVKLRDILGGLGKAAAFAVVIVAVAAHQGFSTGGGAAGVGKSTTRAVVQSIIWIIVVDAFFTAVLYATE